MAIGSHFLKTWSFKFGLRYIWNTCLKDCDRGRIWRLLRLCRDTTRNCELPSWAATPLWFPDKDFTISSEKCDSIQDTNTDATHRNTNKGLFINDVIIFGGYADPLPPPRHHSSLFGYPLPPLLCDDVIFEPKGFPSTTRWYLHYITLYITLH